MPTATVPAATTRYGHGTGAVPLTIQWTASGASARHQTMPSQTFGAPPNRRAYGVRTTIEQDDVSAPQVANRPERRARSRPQRPSRRAVKYRLIAIAGTRRTTSRTPARRAMRSEAEQPAGAADLDLDLHLADPHHLHVAERVALPHQPVVQERDRLAVALGDGVEHVLFGLGSRRGGGGRWRCRRRRAGRRCGLL